MELVKSLTVDSAPALTELFRFALVTGLELVKKILLLFPVNLLIFIVIIIVAFHKLVKMIVPKQRFSKTYTPLKHNDNSAEEVKVLKKEIREVQSEMIEILKKVKQQKR